MDAIDSLRLELEAEKYTHQKDNVHLLDRIHRLRDALAWVATNSTVSDELKVYVSRTLDADSNG